MSAVLATASVASLDIDVVIVGAGVAGLAAASALLARGLSVRVLEAGGRIGGRAWTATPALLGGISFDHGAQWLHDAHHNPLVEVALRHGERVQPDRRFEDRLTIIGDGDATRAFQRAERRWHDAVTPHLSGPDQKLTDAAAAVADDPWTATVEAWEGAIIAAADADVLSLHDWAANELSGENYVSPGGLGAMLARVLALSGDVVRLNHCVTRVALGRHGVTVTAAGGTIRAGAVIVTVSTGVLRAGHIAFSPELDSSVAEALDGLPMGLLSKVALPAVGKSRLGFEADSELFDRVPRRGAPFMPIMMWPDDHPLAVGFIGGRAAWALAESPREAGAFLRRELVRLLGANARETFSSQEAVTTAWGSDPLFLGAYAYAMPGHSGARAQLGRAIWDGRLLFAGEACALGGKAGTVAGAYESGLAAAARVTGFPSGHEPV